MSWLYSRPTEGTIAFLEGKFAKKPEIAAANVRAFRAGYAFGETTEEFAVQYEVRPAKLRPGTYRNVTGNQALAMGLVAASVQSRLPLFLGAYPITPASGILEELARYKHFGVRTFQAEDEIAAVGAALGASFGGALGVSTSSGPGVVLKSETVGLAVDARAAARHPRHPARRALHRDADEARAVRSPHGHVREERGVAGAGAGRLGARPLLRGGDRGGPDRAQVPHARVPPVGRLPGQRLRAVARPERRRPAGHRPGVHHRAERRRPLPPLRPRRAHARARLGRPRDAGPRAPDRRAREGGPHREHLLRPRQPRPHGPPAGAEGRRDRRRHPRADGRPPGGRERARARLGRDARAGRRRRPPRARGGREGRARAPRLPEPVPAEPRRRPALATTGCSSPR